MVTETEDDVLVSNLMKDSGCSLRVARMAIKDSLSYEEALMKAKFAVKLYTFPKTEGVSYTGTTILGGLYFEE